MKGITKFEIKYTYDNKDKVDKVEKQLLSEGWVKTNYNYAAYPEQTKPSDKFFTWFEREWDV